MMSLNERASVTACAHDIAKYLCSIINLHKSFVLIIRLIIAHIRFN